MKPGASVARRSRVKPAAEAITRSVELQSDTELSHAEPEVRIHLPPAQSHVRTGLVKGVEVLFVGVIRLVSVMTLKIEAAGPATALIPFFFPLRPTLFLTVSPTPRGMMRGRIGEAQ
jgi:hypothetical protein